MNAVTLSAVPLTGIARQSIGLLTRHLLLLGDFFRRLQQLSAPAFVKIPGCTDVILYGWSKVVEATEASRFISGLRKFVVDYGNLLNAYLRLRRCRLPY